MEMPRRYSDARHALAHESLPSEPTTRAGWRCRNPYRRSWQFRSLHREAGRRLTHTTVQWSYIFPSSQQRVSSNGGESTLFPRRFLFCRGRIVAETSLRPWFPPHTDFVSLSFFDARFVCFGIHERRLAVDQCNRPSIVVIPAKIV